MRPLFTVVTASKREEAVAKVLGGLQIGIFALNVRVGVVADDVLLVPRGRAHVAAPRILAAPVDPGPRREREVRTFSKQNRRKDRCLTHVQFLGAYKEQSYMLSIPKRKEDS